MQSDALTPTCNAKCSCKKQLVFTGVLKCPVLTLCVNIFSFASSCTAGFHGEKLDWRKRWERDGKRESNFRVIYGATNLWIKSMLEPYMHQIIPVGEVRVLCAIDKQKKN